MLKVRDFNILTNHTRLTHALFRVSLLLSACQQGHLSYLAEFTSSVVHIPGPEKMVADTLSRRSTDSSSAPAPVSSPPASALVFPVSPLASSSNKPVIPGLDFSLLPPLQLSCPSVQEMKLSSSLSLVAVPFGAGSLLCDSSTGYLRPLVPPYSSGGHFSTCSMMSLTLVPMPLGD